MPRMALFVATFAWEASCCWRMEGPSPNPGMGLERRARRLLSWRGVSCIGSSYSLSSATDEADEPGRETSLSVSASGFSEA